MKEKMVKVLVSVADETVHDGKEGTDDYEYDSA